MAILGAIALDLDTAVGDLFDSFPGPPTINATTARSGGNSLRITSTAASATKNIGSNQATLNVAFAWQPSTLAAGTSSLLQVSDAGTLQCNLRVLSDGTIQAYRNNATLLGASGVGAISGGGYQHVECTITISATVGVIQVWVNGTSVLNLTAQNTKQTANATVSGFTIGAPFGATHDYCDIIFSTTRINDSRVECMVPTGAGNYTQFTPSTGSNWQNVDEVPPNGDTDYNDTITVNNIDTFTHGALSSSPTSISAVIVNVRARNTTTGSGSVAPFIRSSSTDAVGTSVALNTSYVDFQTVWETDPHTGSAWANAAAVNAAEIGYKKTV